MRRRDLLLAVPPLLLSGAAAAQEFPSRPVQVVVPFPPGGGTDVLLRLLTQPLQRRLGQPVIIDNRPGATGSIGNDRVAKAAPDGHTLLAQATIISLFPQMMQGLPYDPLRDLAAVGMLSETPTVFVTHPAAPFTTPRDLAPASRQRPLTFGTAGVGSPQHLGTMGMAQQLGIAVEHVPYRGTAPALTDVLGRQLDFAAFSLSSVLPLIQEGKLKALAVHAPRRVRFAPDIPTAAEQGVNDAGSSVRFLLLAPSQTPPAIIARINTALNEVLTAPEIGEAFATRGYAVLSSTPEEAQNEMLREQQIWTPLIRDLGVRITE